MESELWKKVYQIVIQPAKNNRPKKSTFNDARILLIYFWSVINNRPIYWACKKKNWPIFRRRQNLPNPSTMTRRLRSLSIQQLMIKIEQQLKNANLPSIARYIDAKPLVIGGCSKDEQSAYGRGAGSIVRGYKLYAIADHRQGFIHWTVKAMNNSESKVAIELISQIETQGYLVGDNAYDKNILYDAAADVSVQLVAARRRGNGLGHRQHSKHRIRGLKLLEKPIGNALMSSRTTIERMFGNLTTFDGGLGALPFWIRTLPRVEMWVRAKMIFYHLWRDLKCTQKTA